MKKWLESVRLSHVGPFVNVLVPLQPITVLVGKNGTGKSTVLKALGDLHSPTWLRQFSSKLRVPRVGVRFFEHPNRHEFGTLGGAETGMIHGTGVHADENKGEYVSWMRGAVEYDFRAPQFNLSPQIGIENQLMPDCRNLVSTLDRLRDLEDGSLERANELIARLVPPISRIGLVTTGENSKQITARHPGNIDIPFRALSTGTQYLIAMSIFVAKAPDLRCLLIEEPETGLHPGVMGQIVDAFTSLVDDPSSPIEQIVLSTHSPFIYARFWNTPKSVVILEFKDDALQAKTLDEMDDWEAGFTDKDMLDALDLPIFLSLMQQRSAAAKG